MKYETRYPKTIDEAIIALRDAIEDPSVKVVPTNAMFLELLELAARLR